MLRLVCLFCWALALVGAAPQGEYLQTTPVPILRQHSLLNPDGSYQYAYETGNGIVVEEEGYVKSDGQTNSMVVQGSYTYTGDDGVPLTITYIADENGFRPQGSHLPTPPPIPPEIQRSLEYLASQPPSPEDYDGQQNYNSYPSGK